LIKILM